MAANGGEAQQNNWRRDEGPVLGCAIGPYRDEAADGHQAVQPNAIGKTKWDAAKGVMTLVDLEYYAADCVNPPEGRKAADWIAAGFPGANCSNFPTYARGGRRGAPPVLSNDCDHHGTYRDHPR
ncbi:MAG: hypothetical protein R3E68_21460 [Burkholderiaceae bacterium]